VHQKIAKGWLTRLQIRNDTRQNLDRVLANSNLPNSPVTSIEVFRICRHYLLFCPGASAYGKQGMGCQVFKKGYKITQIFGQKSTYSKE
jgi:hypothetical protein